MERHERHARAATFSHRRLAGVALDGLRMGLAAFGAAWEMIHSTLPVYTGYRAPLQNPDGTFGFRVDGDGELEAGTWGVDELGRFVDLS